MNDEGGIPEALAQGLSFPKKPPKICHVAPGNYLILSIFTNPQSEKPLGFEYRVVLSKTTSKNSVQSLYSKLSFFMTIHLSIFLKLYKSLFNLLYFLYLWIQCTFPSANPIFCFSIFYAVTASTFPCLRSLFSAPQFFMRRWPPLFLIHKAHFLCFSVFYAITASPFPCQAKPVFC